MQEDFNINGIIIKPGQSVEANLNVYRLPTRTFIEIPIHIFRSLNEGPTLLLNAGMHGDEINGIEIIRRLLRGSFFDNLKCGSVLVIPILNIVSFINAKRELPDGRDLNRCFPGSTFGSLGSRIANDLMHKVVPLIDYAVDFHTGGAMINNYPQIRCSFDDAKSVELAALFGAPFTVNASYRDKTFRKEAAYLNKPVLVYEAGESRRFSTKALEMGVEGCLRLMKNLNMLDVAVPETETILLKNSRWVRAKMSGLFNCHKKYGSFIEKNEIIGSIADPFGDTEIPLIAPEKGFLIGINNKPVINEGDALMHIGVR